MSAPRLVNIGGQFMNALNNKIGDNKAIITQVMAAPAWGDPKPWLDALADDFVFRQMAVQGRWARAYEGKEVCRAELWGRLARQYDGRYTNTARAIYADGDHVIVEAEGAVMLKSGKPYNNKYCFVIAMENGKMRELREYCDFSLA